MKKFIPLAGVLLFILTFLGMSAYRVFISEEIVSISPCEKAGGQWSAEFRECLGVDATTCESIGGKFNECASACRNDPKAEICTMQCVIMCEIQ